MGYYNSQPLNSGLFNYAAEQLGMRYRWNDEGAKGYIEEGEITKKGKVIELGQLGNYNQDVDTIILKAEKLSETTLVFSSTEAMPQRRIYQKSSEAIADVSADLKGIPNTDTLYERMGPYLEVPANSCQEGQIAELFMADLRALGFEVRQDDAHTKITCEGDFTDGKEIQAETGNVLAHLEGDPDLPSWHLSIHLDGTTPQIAPIPHVREGDVLRTTGDSILRGDDVGGIVLGLEFVAYLKNNRIPHGDIYFDGLIAEETGANGAQQIGLDGLQGDIGLVLDGADTEVVYGGSNIWLWNLTVKGRAEHISLAPTVVNAQIVASHIISGAWGMDAGSSYHGNPDTVIVANSVQSGSGYEEDGEQKVRKSNSVPDLALLSGQMRTREPDSEGVIEEMRGEMDGLCARMEAACTLSAQLVLPGWQDPAMTTLFLVRNGYEQIGGETPEFMVHHGGSNANFTYPKRGELVILPLGAKYLHTPAETLDLAKLRRTLEAMVSMATDVARYEKR